VDVALGATNVPLPRKLLAAFSACFWTLLFLSAALAVSSRPVHADTEEAAIHTSGDKSYWDRKNNRVKLVGHAIVRQEGEILTADNMELDFTSHMLDAKGHCVYVTVDSVIYGDEMHMNLETRTGVVIGARVSNDRFTLAGERLNKLAEGRFQVHNGEYSTCKDCPNAWSLEAEDVDITFGGYAYMSNVLTKIEDAPTFWLPYMIFPIKTARQTGFLFPTYHISNTDGFAFVMPFFWAINRSSDMTLGLGDYTNRGPRAELEGRYSLSKRSGGIADLYFIRDSSFTNSSALPIGGIIPPQSYPTNRWGVNAFQTQELPFGIEEKLKLTEVSDNHYPIDFGNDINNIAQNRDLSSNLIFNYGGSDLSAYLEMNRYRNLLPTDPNPYTVPSVSDPNRYSAVFDPMTVQLYPAAVATTNDRFLFGSPIAGGLTFGAYNFTRSAGLFDYDNQHEYQVSQGILPSLAFIPGVDPLREATRLSFSPNVYTTFRPFDVLEVVPSATYHAYFYSFHDTPLIPNLERDYLQLQLSLSSQIEKIWDTPDPDRPRQKHFIRPVLTYSNIPVVHESDPNHPFLQQISYAQSNNFSGYNFDDNDIVPINQSPSETQYFDPLGNSVNVGFDTQLITRIGAIDKPDPRYVQNIDFSAGETINFKQFENGAGQQQPFNRFFSNLNLNVGQFQSSSTYYYYPYSPNPRNFIATTETYIFQRAVHDRVLTFDRSLSFTYVYDCRNGSGVNCAADNVNANLNFSISDYLLPQAYIAYSYVAMTINDVGGSMTFQSPAQCYKLGISYDHSVQNHSSTIGFDVSLNITGNGFGLVQNGTPTNPASAPPGAPGTPGALQ
jgi:hypothetical protein